MAFYASYTTNATSSPSPPRNRHHAAISQPSSPSAAVNWDDAEAYLSSDLDISFASTMSINSAPSSPTQTGRIDPFSLGPSTTRTAAPSPIERMDISPAVPKRTSRGNSSAGLVERPFGVEVSNVFSPAVDSSPIAPKNIIATRPRSRTTAGLPPIRGPQFERSLTSSTNKSSVGTASGNTGRARAGLPGAWLQVPGVPSRPLSAASNRSKRSGAVFTVSCRVCVHKHQHSCCRFLKHVSSTQCC